MPLVTYRSPPQMVIAKREAEAAKKRKGPKPISMLGAGQPGPSLTAFSQGSGAGNGQT